MSDISTTVKTKISNPVDTIIDIATKTVSAKILSELEQTEIETTFAEAKDFRAL
jgi:hypothetical protein